jgi:signal transduction histidine kinase
LEQHPPPLSAPGFPAEASAADVAVACAGALCAAVVALVAVVIGASPGASALDVVVPAVTAAAFIAGGLLAWRRRPHNRCGLLMVWVGLTFLLAGLADADIEALRALGLLCQTLPLAAAIHLLLAFPSGRVAERAARVVAAAGYVVALVLQVPRELLGDGSSPLHVAEAPAADDALAAVQAAAGIALLVWTAAILGMRLRRSGPAARGALGPLRWYGPLALAIAAAGAVIADTSSSERVQTAAGVVQTAALAGLPLAFLAGLLGGGFGRAGEVHELLADVGEASVDPAALRGALARALGDDSLEVLYRRGGEPAAYVDARGVVADLPRDELRRASRVALGGEVVGALVYDASLTADDELVDELARISALVIEHQRLSAELRASVVELEAAAGALREAQQRIVRAADDERRRIARDLHDGAQQRLVALGIDAQRIARRADQELVERGARELSAGLAAVLDELRALVQGIMPPALVDRGLPAAASVLVQRMPIPVDLRVAGIERRLAQDVEATAYFVIAESLTNTVKHARSAEAEVVLERGDDVLTVEVRDRGAGGADLAAGTGLRGLADRVAAVGGAFAVRDRPGGGTVVHAEIPCGS